MASSGIRTSKDDKDDEVKKPVGPGQAVLALIGGIVIGVGVTLIVVVVLVILMGILTPSARAEHDRTDDPNVGHILIGPGDAIPTYDADLGVRDGSPSSNANRRNKQKLIDSIHDMGFLDDLEEPLDNGYNPLFQEELDRIRAERAK